jgi:hypothetical protein
MLWPTFLVLTVLLGSPPAVPTPQATRVTVDLSVHSAPAAPVEGRILAQAVGDDVSSVASPVEPSFAAPGRVDVTVAHEGLWEVRAVSPGWWSEPATVYVKGPAALVSLVLWPDCAIKGRVELPKGENAPSDIGVSFSAATEPMAAPGGRIRLVRGGEPIGSVRCPVEEGVFECRIPAGTLDLKLRARSFVSHYLWRRSVPPHAQVDLGTLVLIPGASLVGWVTTADGPPPPGTAEVTLSPRRAMPQSVARAIENRDQVLTTRPDQRGFFSFDGIDQAAYLLQATAAGFVPAQVDFLTVIERTELELRDPLVLQRPVTLVVEVSPARDVWGKPWTLRVVRPEVFPEATALETPVGDRGRVEHGGMAPGMYRALLVDSAGDRFLAEDFELTASSPPLLLEPETIPLTGTMFLGDIPLAAELTFFRPPALRVRTPSDEDGAYSVALPAEGLWSLQVTAQEWHLRRTLHDLEVRLSPSLGEATLDVHLPSNTLEGVVVDEVGWPVAGATVTVVHPASLETEQTTSGDDGTFELAGLEAGQLTASAEDIGPHGEQRTSEPVTVELADRQPSPPVTLVLADTRELVVRVRGDGGAPVIGADVMLLADVTRAPQGVTDQTGAVKLQIPRNLDRYAAVIRALGFALRSFEVVVRDEPELTAELSLDHLAGWLVIELPEDLTQPGGGSQQQHWLWQNGARVDPPLLHVWAAMHGVPPSPGSTRLRIPEMGSGQYRGCLVPIGAPSQEGGSPPPAMDCVEGFLAPGGELTLDLSGAE